MSTIAMWLLTLWGVTPGILWFWWLYRRDHWDPEPLNVCGDALWAGFWAACGAVLGTLGLGWLLGLPVLGDPSSIGQVALRHYAVVGPVEEGAKLLALLIAVVWRETRRRELDEPIDFLVYAGGVALGFASIENVGYLMKYGAGLGFARAVLSVPGHLLFSSLFGYALAMRWLRGGSWWGVLFGWALAALCHGTFNFCASLAPFGYGWAFQGSILVVLGLGLLFWFRMRRLREMSPFRPGYGRVCPACGERTPDDGQYCERYGATLSDGAGPAPSAAS